MNSSKSFTYPLYTKEICCPTRTRTWNNRTKTCCVAITPWDTNDPSAVLMVCRRVLLYDISLAFILKPNLWSSYYIPVYDSNLTIS